MKNPIILLFCCFISCTPSHQTINKNYKKKSTYSLSLSGNKQIQIPKELNINPNYVQYLETDNEKYFVCFDEINNRIYWMEFQSGKIQDDRTIQITIPHEGISLYSYALSSDSIFVLDYNQTSKLYLINAQGAIKSKFTLGINKGSLIGTDQEPYCTGNELLLSGFILDEITTQQGTLFPCYVYDMRKNQYQPVATVDYPKEYYHFNWGWGNMRFVSSEACYGLKSILYNFPISHNIYVYDVIEKKMKNYDGGSCLIEKIEPYSVLKEYNPAENVDYLKYYFQQPSYFKIIYDPHRSLYYRFAGLPSEMFDVKNMKTYKKKLSVIILDKNFQFLGETLLNEQYDYIGAFVNEDGLHIMSEYDPEKTITYHIFEPKTINP